MNRHFTKRTRKNEKVRERIRNLYLEIRRLYPRCPNPWRVAECAFFRRDGVGFDETLRLRERADRAVASYLRHNRLPYYDLMAAGATRAEARDLLTAPLHALFAEWQGRRPLAMAA